MRFIVTPDSEYDSGLYHVIDTVEKNQWGEQKCVLSYVQRRIAEQECNRLNLQKSGV